MYFHAAQLFDEEIHQSSSCLMFASLEKNCCHWTLCFLFLGWKICLIKSHTFKPCAFRLSRTWSNLSYFYFLNLSSLSSLCVAQARAHFLCPVALQWAACSLGSDSRIGLECIGPLEELQNEQVSKTTGNHLRCSFSDPLQVKTFFDEFNLEAVAVNSVHKKLWLWVSWPVMRAHWLTSTCRTS